eukprot:gene17341-22887_t
MLEDIRKQLLENSHIAGSGNSHRSQRKRAQSFDSVETNGMNDPWGWFDDFENQLHSNYDNYSDVTTNSNRNKNIELRKTMSLPLPLTNPPRYVLESTVETQHLWYETAGQRPQQPQHEREYFENLWKRNFEVSSVVYSSKLDDKIKKVQTDDENLRVDVDGGEILYRGHGPFSISVSKSFQSDNISCVTLQMPSFRIIRSSDGDHAEFLVVVTFSNIQALSLAKGKDTFKNTLLSWQCLLNRKRWYKCLDKDYLSLKCFLLERFMHDFLFESPSPTLISEFLGLE